MCGYNIKFVFFVKLYGNKYDNLLMNFVDAKYYHLQIEVARDISEHLLPYCMGLTDNEAVNRILEKRLLEYTKKKRGAENG